MADFLPQFPLQIVVFPGELVNLHIFEPRYRELVQDCEDSDITFGIPVFLGGKVQSIGTEVRLEEVVKKYPEGESDIRVRGTGLYSIQKFLPRAPGKLYAAAEIEKLRIENRPNPAMQEQILEKATELLALLRLDRPLPEQATDLRTYDIGHHVGLNLEQEYELLSLLTEFERQQYLLNHLENVLPVVREMENLKQKVQMNGHFRKLKPPNF